MPDLLEGGVYHLKRYEELKVKLGLVRNRIDRVIELNAEGTVDIGPYNASLGLYVNSKLNDALVLLTYFFTSLRSSRYLSAEQERVGRLVA